MADEEKYTPQEVMFSQAEESHILGHYQVRRTSDN